MLSYPLNYLLRASRHPLLPLFAHTLLASHELPLQHPEYRTTPARIRSKPHIVNVQAFQGVNASVVAGTPVDPLAVVNAENTVEFLSGAEMGLPGVITNEVIETAKNRAHKLTETHASLQFGLQPGVGVFVQHQFHDFGELIGQMNTRLARLEAMMENTRILSLNRRFPGIPLRPLKKYVPGEGHALALVICVQAQLPADVQGYHPEAEIGDVPPAWNGHIDEYLHVDILRAVIFYNDDFGIVPGDSMVLRREKFKNWLSEQN